MLDRLEFAVIHYLKVVGLHFFFFPLITVNFRFECVVNQMKFWPTRINSG